MIPLNWKKEQLPLENRIRRQIGVRLSGKHGKKHRNTKIQKKNTKPCIKTSNVHLIYNLNKCLDICFRTVWTTLSLLNICGTE